MSQSIRIHFLGAAGTVTGSRFLIETSGKKLLIDCGMFQGVKSLRDLNWQPLPVDASQIDHVLLTHGHLDHVGSLPRLVTAGYEGHILGTAPTLDIAGIILRDSARLQEEHAKKANKEKFTRHKPARPLYTIRDAEKVTGRFRPCPKGEWIELGDQLRVRFRHNGHILGATFIELDLAGRRWVFSGDIGRLSDPLLSPPERPEKADVLVMEGTYGDRLHPAGDPLDPFGKVVEETLEKQGALLIPGFAVERAQLLMFLLWKLSEQGRLPSGLPIVMDSPMGADVLDLFRKHHEWHTLDDQQAVEMCRRVRVIKSYRESVEVMEQSGPKIVIAGSGMVTGGRILNYLERYVGRPETTVMLAGYQAEGTRGRQLLEGALEIKFFGTTHPVKARIEYLDGLSGHADQAELVDWTSRLKTPPSHTFLVHGEAQALDSLRVKLRDVRGWEARIPELYEVAELQPG